MDSKIPKKSFHAQDKMMLCPFIKGVPLTRDLFADLSENEKIISKKA